MNFNQTAPTKSLTADWKHFLLKDLCSIDMGNKLDFSAMAIDEPTINFVGRSADNNGVMGRVNLLEGVAPYPAGSITVALGGSLGSTFFQAEPFYTSQNVAVLQFDTDIVPESARLFLATMIQFESQFKYFPFGRELNKYIRTIYGFDLPVQRTEDGQPVIDPTNQYSPDGYIPDWQFMENFIRGLHHEPITTENPPETSLPLDHHSFESFTFGALVDDIRKAKAHTKEDLSEAPYSEAGEASTIRYVTRTAENNGCEMLVYRNAALEIGVQSGNAISIGDTTATCFYQSEDFVAGDHMVVVRADWMNPFTGNYIATLLNREAFRYSYGRAFVMQSIRSTTLQLPIVRNNNGDPVIDPDRRFHEQGFIPDWQFMENYIRSLPYGDRIPEEV